MNSIQIEEYLKLVESIDTDSASIQEIRDILEPIVGLISLGSPLIDNSQFFYRAVKLKQKSKMFDELIYPPKQYLTKHQRLNEPHCPVFYCSTSQHACVYEGRYKEGDFVTVSQWEVMEGKNLVTTNVGYTEYLSKWSKRPVPTWHLKVNNNDEFDDVKKTNKIILNFLSQLFCKNFDDQTSKYKLSIAISNLLGFNTECETELEKIGHQHFKGTSPFEALLYPSILLNAEADNLAIRRFSFHKKIKFVSAEYMKINSVNDKEFKLEEIDFANEIDENGRILWKGRKGKWDTPYDVEVVLTYVSENQFTIARKDGGKLYKV